MSNRSRFQTLLKLSLIGLFPILMASCIKEPASAEKVRIRLAVSLTPQELETFETRLDEVREAFPGFEIVLETTPQAGLIEKVTTQLASDTLPDILRIPGLNAQQWIQRGAFLDLTGWADSPDLNLEDFYPSPIEQFRWQGKLYGIPDTAAPNAVFYNRSMFDAAGLDYPDEAWTYEDMREAAILLTLDGQGRNPMEADFDEGDIQQWGWNSGVTYYWQRDLLSIFGGDPCVNPDCTKMDFTSDEILNAVEWWASLVHDDHAALYDPFGGAQTGIPGDPFLAGKVAMGSGGYFLIGQLKATGTVQYGVIEPFHNLIGERITALSTNGYLISARSEHPDEAKQLVQALLNPEFLTDTWGVPGHSIPARRSAASGNLAPSLTSEEVQVILAAMEYGEVFKPYTASAFEVYARTSDFFVQAMKGDIPVSQAMEQVEQIANEILAKDLQP
jgi:multiple sugar transport system substrate-binding protein